VAACHGKNANWEYFALFPAYFSQCQQLHEPSVKGKKRVLKALCKWSFVKIFKLLASLERIATEYGTGSSE
jgi:hypothetical protein